MFWFRLRRGLMILLVGVCPRNNACFHFVCTWIGAFSILFIIDFCLVCVLLVLLVSRHCLGSLRGRVLVCVFILCASVDSVLRGSRTLLKYQE